MSDGEDARKHHTVAIKLLSCGAASSKSILCATKPAFTLRVLGPDADQDSVLQDRSRLSDGKTLPPTTNYSRHVAGHKRKHAACNKTAN